MARLVELFYVISFLVILCFLPLVFFVLEQNERKNSSSALNVTHKMKRSKWPRQKLKFLKTPTLNMEPSCSQKSCHSSKWDMLILVKSSAVNARRRNLIRETWGSVKFFNGLELRTIFVVGKADRKTQSLLYAEHRKHQDMLLIDKKDIYKNVVLKTLGSMQWAAEHFPDEYLFSSADDDIFLNLENMLKAISLYSDIPSVNLPIICMYELRRNPGSPDRWRPSKYFVSKQQYDGDRWPQYCPGATYTMSMVIARKIWQASRNNEILPVDDVLVTGILRQKIDRPDNYLAEVHFKAVKHYEGFYGSLSPKRFKKEWEEFLLQINNTQNCFC